MTTLAEMNTSEGSIAAILCPDPSCRAPITEGTLRNLLTSESFDRWQRLTLSRTLDAMADVFACPRCQTPTIEEGGLVPKQNTTGSQGVSISASTCTSEKRQSTRVRNKTSGLGEAGRLARCPNPTCGFAFCPGCFESYHPASPCLGSEGQAVELERLAVLHFSPSLGSVRQSPPSCLS